GDRRREPVPRHLRLDHRHRRRPLGPVRAGPRPRPPRSDRRDDRAGPPARRQRGDRSRSRLRGARQDRLDADGQRQRHGGGHLTPAIRPATGADAAACAAIYAPFVTDSWISFELDPPSAAEMATRIADCGASHGWLVAELDGEVAGYAYGSPHRTRAAYASSCDVAVYVDPAHPRQGIGRALYSALLPLLASKGLHAAFAGIALPNEA